jgi:hypothetical protein
MKLNSKLGTSAVAAAVAIACGGAYAASISAPTQTVWSLQHNSKAAATSVATGVSVVSVEVVLGADYIVNDSVALNLDSTSGAKFLNTSTSTLSSSTGAVNCGSSAVVLSFLSRSDTAANYRVSSTGGSASGATCTFSLPLVRSSLTTEDVVPKVSWSAKTAQSGIDFDTSAVVATLGTVVDQFSVEAEVTTPLLATVDVDSQRYQFTSVSSDTSSLGGRGDTLTFTLSAGATVETAANISTIVTSLEGDFSFIDNNGTAGCQVSDLSNGHGQIRTTSGTLTIDSGCSLLTFTTTSVGAKTIVLGTSSTAVTASNIQVLDAPQSFTMGALTYNYYAGSTASAARSGSSSVDWEDVEAGEWTLNGSVAKISYMPYGTGISRIVYITNRSTQSGGVSAIAINDAGEECEIANVATAAKGAVTILSTGLDAGVAACYGANFNGKVAFEITSNVPASDAEIYSAYNVNGNRVLVVNDTNGKN